VKPQAANFRPFPLSWTTRRGVLDLGVEARVMGILVHPELAMSIVSARKSTFMDNSPQNLYKDSFKGDATNLDLSL
jgi:hypothetical protein